MMMKYLIAAAGVSLVVSGSLYAQTRTAEEGEALQRSLEEKAVRIPAKDLAAALRADEDGRADRAQTRPREPNWAAVHADLQRTAEDDASNQTTQELTTTRAISRPNPPGLRAMVADRMSTVQREEISLMRMPVLLPAHPAMRDKFKIYGMRNVYTATTDIDAEASLSISGTCNRVIGGDPDIVAFRKRLAEKPRRLPGTGAEYHISRNDYGVDLSFSKFGCGYVMTIECGNPADDPRCAADQFIMGVADGMMLANPELAGGE